MKAWKLSIYWACLLILGSVWYECVFGQITAKVMKAEKQIDERFRSGKITSIVITVNGKSKKLTPVDGKEFTDAAKGRQVDERSLEDGIKDLVKDAKKAGTTIVMVDTKGNKETIDPKKDKKCEETILALFKRGYSKASDAQLINVKKDKVK